MAAFTFGPGHPFPAGTTIAAYADKGQNPSGQPSGAATASGVVGSNGTLAISGLAAGVTYWAVAQLSGVWVWVRVTVPRDPESAPGETEFATGADLAVVEARLDRHFDDSQIVALYAAVNGSGVNDGLSAAAPLPFATVLDEALMEYGPFLAGTFTLNLAAGTYDPDGVAFQVADKMLARRRIHIKGPDVGGHPNVPTAIIDAAGLGNGIIGGLSTFGTLEDVKVVNVSVSDSGTAAGFLGEEDSDWWLKNFHGDGDAYAMISSQGERLRVTGGKVDGPKYGIRLYSGCTGTIGYTVVPPIIRNHTDSAILVQHAYADCFAADISGGPRSLFVTSGGRAWADHCLFKNATKVAVEAQEGSQVEVIGQSNDFTGSAKILELDASSTALSIHGTLDASSEVRIKKMVPTPGPLFDHTGARAVKVNPIFTFPAAGEQWIIDHHFRIVLFGTMTGLGTKSPEVAVGSTPYAVATSSADYGNTGTGYWRMEVDIFCRGPLDTLTMGRYFEDGAVVKMIPRQVRNIDLSGDTMRLYAATSAAGHVLCDGCEVYLA